MLHLVVLVCFLFFTSAAAGRAILTWKMSGLLVSPGHHPYTYVYGMGDTPISNDHNRSVLGLGSVSRNETGEATQFGIPAGFIPLTGFHMVRLRPLIK